MRLNAGIAIALAILVTGSAFAQEQTVETLTVEENITIGDEGTKPINSFIDSSPVPSDNGPVFIGNTTEFADAITIDSGSNFPPGIAFRRYLGDPEDPQVVEFGTQLGYLDFRAYSGGYFFNAASFDVVVDSLSPLVEGEPPPTKMRFGVSNGDRTSIPMELRANGRLELGAIEGEDYIGPGSFGDPRLYVNSRIGDWGVIFAGNSTSSPNYALKTYSATANASDYLFAGASGPGGAVVFSVRGNGDTYVAGDLFVGGENVGASLGELDSRVSESAARIDANEMQVGLHTALIAENTARIGDLTVGLEDHEQRIGVVEAAQETSSAKLANQAFGSSATAYASGAGATAVGPGARANLEASSAVGYNAVASGVSATAIGASAQAVSTNTTALGPQAKALRDGAVAVGYKALAFATNGVAVGNSAVVTHDNSVAVGAGARSSAPDQVTLGGQGTSVRVGDLAASTAAQVGPVEVVTVDQNGTLGRQQIATQGSVEAVRTSMSHIAAVADEQFSALSERVSGLAGQLDTLFDLNKTVDKDAKQGIAAVAAMSHPHFPSEPGKTSYASNVSVYRGEVGFSAGIMHRFDGDFAVTAGATYAGGKSAAVRAGVAGEF